jgi:hypothetical protein
VRKGFWTDVGVVLQAILPDQRQVPRELCFVSVFPGPDLLLHRTNIHGFRDDYDSQVQEMRREGQSVDPLFSEFRGRRTFVVIGSDLFRDGLHERFSFYRLLSPYTGIHRFVHTRDEFDLGVEGNGNVAEDQFLKPVYR